MTKQEYIQQAYGEYWSKVKQYVDEDGRISTENCYEIWRVDDHPEKFYKGVVKDLNLILDHDYMDYQPGELCGIEWNNNWLSFVDVDYSFLLKNSGWVYTDKGNIYTIKDYSSLFSISETQKITHYQLIEEPKPPLYE